MDVTALQQDIDTACGLLNALAVVFPQATVLQQYIGILQNILDNPTILLLLATWINTLQPAPVPPIVHTMANGDTITLTNVGPGAA